MKTTESGGVHGYDAGKKIKGRKRPHQHVRIDGLCEHGKATDIGKQDRIFALLSFAGAGLLFGCGDLLGNLGREKLRQIMRRRAVDDGPDQRSPGPAGGDRDDRGDGEDGDNLVDLGANQNAV